MKNSKMVKAILFICVVIAAVVSAAFWAWTPLDQISYAAVTNTNSTWVSLSRGNNVRISLINENGTQSQHFDIKRYSKNTVAQVLSMAVNENGVLYVLTGYTNAFTGEYTDRQEIIRYEPDGWLSKKKVIPVVKTNDERAIQYLSIQADSSLLLHGVVYDKSTIIRKALDENELAKGTMLFKTQREYPADIREGVQNIVSTGLDIMYLSKTGKVFYSAEASTKPISVYPDKSLVRSTYVSFITSYTDEEVVIGKQTSGDILRIDKTGAVRGSLLLGDQSYGRLAYLAKDTLQMSLKAKDAGDMGMVSIANDNTGKPSAIILGTLEKPSLIHGIRTNVLAIIGSVIKFVVIYSIIAAVILIATLGLYQYTKTNRKLLAKLLLVSVPLLLGTLIIFGGYSFISYENALSSTYKTKVADQGSLLRALFTTETYDKITYPETYFSKEYQYILTQMNTREVYTSTAYYTNGKLYTGVDHNLPSLYPFAIRQSPSAAKLYEQAALSGRQQTGVIEDAYGKRIACVTPAGSSSGNTVFLVETSIFDAEISAQTRTYLISFVGIAAICIALACATMFFLFRRTLSPLAGIVKGLDAFSKGNIETRLASSTNDELADITRVFNKMAWDTDIQLYNLRSLSETYYHFVPRQIFELLGKRNLADVTLGNRVDGSYCILSVNLFTKENEFDLIQEHINTFFNVIHVICTENKATILPDGANLQKLKIICTSADDAINIAMRTTAQIDSLNTGKPLSASLEVAFLLHSCTVGFGICGDDTRYVPAMISTQLDEVQKACEPFQRISSRVLVTQPAYEALTSISYKGRYIGKQSVKEQGDMGMYDFYECSSQSVLRLTQETQVTFEKAINLFEQKRYYDAKNLFTMVLRENRFDNVARYYIFECEKNL